MKAYTVSIVLNHEEIEKIESLVGEEFHKGIDGRYNNFILDDEVQDAIEIILREL